MNHFDTMVAILSMSSVHYDVIIDETDGAKTIELRDGADSVYIDFDAEGDIL